MGRPDAYAGVGNALLAANLVALRRAKELSQEALAFEAGLHRTFVVNVVRQVRNISGDNIEKLALASAGGSLGSAGVDCHLRMLPAVFDLATPLTANRQGS